MEETLARDQQFALPLSTLRNSTMTMLFYSLTAGANQKIIRTHPAHTEGKLTASDRILSADGTKSSKNCPDSILK
jgi:uncharacterized RDD family membrane protein YckC